MGGNGVKGRRITTRSAGRLATVVLALAPLLLAACGDDLAQNCPPDLPAGPDRRGREQPLPGEGRRVGAAAPSTRGQDVRAVAFARTRQVSTPVRGQLLRIPAHAPQDGRQRLRREGPLRSVNDAGCSELIAYTLEHGLYGPQATGNPRFTVKYNEAQSECRSGDRGFRVVVGGGTFAYGGVITAFRLRTAPPTNP
jgi:hypothetical protein